MHSIEPITQPDLSARPFRATTERTMSSPPSVVFRAWTELLDRWSAVPGTILMKPEVNTPFFFETQHAGERHPHYGRFLKLVPQQLIETTWLTAAGTNGYETVVTVELAPNGAGTRLRLTHSGFPNETLAERHQQAWPNVLAELDRAFPPNGQAV